MKARLYIKYQLILRLQQTDLTLLVYSKLVHLVTVGNVFNSERRIIHPVLHAEPLGLDTHVTILSHIVPSIHIVSNTIKMLQLWPMH